jgi:AhpD family alkylhydroperoxidase
MPTIKMVDENKVKGKAKRILNEIRGKMGAVNDMYKIMARDPDYLEAIWRLRSKVMSPGRLDMKTKEMIALAVSATNSCEPCIVTHTNALKKMGVDDDSILELMSVVHLYNGSNKFNDGLMVQHGKIL